MLEPTANMCTLDLIEKRSRILIGTFDTGLINDFAAGFRALGHHVTTVVFHRPPFLEGLQYDIDIGPLSPSPIQWPMWVEASKSVLVRIPRGSLNRAAHVVRLGKLILNHDVFFFQCGGISLTQGNIEYPFLKVLGKKIVAGFMGGEARNIDAYKAQYGPESTTPELEADCYGRMGHDPWSQMRNIRLAEKYADVILSQPNQSSLAVRPYSHLFIPIVLERYTNEIPGREVPIVLHAPSSEATKGTRWILEAVNKLQADGIRFNFKLLQNIPNEAVGNELVKADILIDQLFFHYHGKLTLEALASGCAVASSNDEDFEPFPPNRPIWHIDRTNIYDQLKSLLQSKERRLELAVAGRPYVERFHDHIDVARRIIEQVGAGKEDKEFQHVPTYFAAHYEEDSRNPIPAALKRATENVIRRFGLPPGVDRREMEKRGLLLWR